MRPHLFLCAAGFTFALPGSVQAGTPSAISLPEQVLQAGLIQERVVRAPAQLLAVQRALHTCAAHMRCTHARASGACAAQSCCAPITDRAGSPAHSTAPAACPPLTPSQLGICEQPPQKDSNCSATLEPNSAVVLGPALPSAVSDAASMQQAPVSGSRVLRRGNHRGLRLVSSRAAVHDRPSCLMAPSATLPQLLVTGEQGGAVAAATQKFVSPVAGASVPVFGSSTPWSANYSSSGATDPATILWGK